MESRVVGRGVALLWETLSFDEEVYALPIVDPSELAVEPNVLRGVAYVPVVDAQLARVDPSDPSSG